MGRRDSRRSPKMRRRKSQSKFKARNKAKVVAGKAAKTAGAAPAKKK